MEVAVRRALEERLALLERERLLADMAAIQKSCAELPVLDDRSADESLGYDENGLPT